MFKLLNAEDSKLMAKANFVKNAVFYKDLLAFYDAFEQIQSEDKENLPNYCLFRNGDYCLEGICLLISIYQSEFGFESVRLSQDYLKVLYYCLCGYSEDGETVSKEAIFAEREQYYEACKKMESSLLGEFDIASASANKVKEKFKKTGQKLSSSGKNMVFTRILYIFFFVFAFFMGMIPFAFYNTGKLTLSYAILISGALVTAGLMLSIFFKMLYKHFLEQRNDMAYSLQGLKKKNQDVNRQFIRSQDNVSRLICEKYEYEHNFSEHIENFHKKLQISQVLEKARQYNLLTYNQLMDIKRLFETQKRDEEEIVDLISVSNEMDDPVKNLANIYSKIKESDWLFYNLNVRYHFIQKFIDIAKVSHNWTIDAGAGEEQPFGMNVKKMATQKVAYLGSMDEPFISSSFDMIEKTSFVKNLQADKDFSKLSIEEERQIKTNLIRHFYSYDELKKYNNLFAEKRIGKDAKVTPEIIDGKQSIPVSMMIKLKIAESDMGYENYNSNAIKQIADNILKVSREQLKDLSANEIDSVISTYPSTVFVSEVDSCEDMGDCIKYVIGGREIIGYKFVI